MAEQPRFVTCGRCGYEDEIRKIEGMLPDLPGAWAAVALLVKPRVHMVLCPVCTTMVRTLLTIPEFTIFRQDDLQRLRGVADAARAIELEAVRSGADAN